MEIAFTRKRWEKIVADSELWWAGQLERPLVQVTLRNRIPACPEPLLPRCHNAACYGLDASISDIVDRFEYEMAARTFLGDSFPSIEPRFGPGVVATYLGAEVHSNERTVWLTPLELKDINDLKFAYNPENIWLKRTKDLYQEINKRWAGLVAARLTDLGGALDILATFRLSENLLFDLYDHPAEVKEKVNDIHEFWFKYFDELSAASSFNYGTVTWARIFSTKPYYMYQCDFCYMISTDMFEEFVRPELEASFRRLPRSFYHLDGVGQLNHLDSLLEIPELTGVQWVPGVGKPRHPYWKDVYRKIRQAGKLMQVHNLTFDELDGILDCLGSGKGIHARINPGNMGEDECRRKLEKIGII